ncbi:MAG: HD domain-containing protein, partial [Spirochaetales bacterium]|nr:HD domain-containing protein [Spirochaetales bacterium]
GLEVIWFNNSFSEYFPGETIINRNLSALTKTQLKSRISALPNNSGKFNITLTSDKKLSSTVIMIVFPLDPSNSENPKNFIGFIDDLTESRNKMLRKTYMGLLEASKLKDDDTGNHIKRVGAFARALSEACYKNKLYPEINLDFIESIHFLAPMHDVGKIGTPDNILTKRGPLDDAEWAIMKEHTINGALILSNYPDKMASEIARAHHEKWDGSGYLFGLAGEDIPLAARITAIADVYDALRMKRSYKDAFPHEKAVDIITSSSGSHFDPTLIKVFLSIEKDFENICTALSDEPPEGLQMVENWHSYSESDTYSDVEEIEELEEL